MNSVGSHDSELAKAHASAILRLQDEDCRKIQYFLEQICAYWSPLPELKLPSDPNVLSYWPISPRSNFRIAPSPEDIEVVARFLYSCVEHIQILAAKALRHSAPEHSRAKSLVRAALEGAHPGAIPHFKEAIAFLSAVDPGSEQWRTSRRSQAQSRCELIDIPDSNP
jgi:hypothetical protein